MREPLRRYLQERRAEGGDIDPRRRVLLDRLAAFVVSRRQRAEPARLLFVCTHNSRRSHLAQVWAQAAALAFGIDGVTCSSGGTEATAVHPNTQAALQRAGFLCERGEGANPVVRVAVGEGEPLLDLFSKRLDDPVNPDRDFVAIMTCSEADAGCPLVPGAVERISLPYRDPKEADGTEAEAATYDARCAEIARETIYTMERVAEDLSRPGA